MFCATLSEMTPLSMNLELFIDRYMIAQGTNFWNWSIYTAKNFYELNGDLQF